MSDEVFIAMELVDGPNLDPRRLELIREWFAEILVSREHRASLFGEIESEASGGLELPLVARLAARVKGTLRSSNEYRKEIRMRAGRDPEELIRGANALLDAVHEGLAQRKQRLCVVFDNLEKIQDRGQVDAAVLRRADDLRRLRCHVVYFLSPADQHSPTSSQVDQLFQLVEVPVIPIRTDPHAPPEDVEAGAVEVIRPQTTGAIATLNFNRDLLRDRLSIPVVMWLSQRAARAFALLAADTEEIEHSAMLRQEYDRLNDSLTEVDIARELRALGRRFLPPLPEPA